VPSLKAVSVVWAIAGASALMMNATQVYLSNIHLYIYINIHVYTQNPHLGPSLKAVAVAWAAEAASALNGALQLLINRYG